MSEVSPAARNTLDFARIPRASKLLILWAISKGPSFGTGRGGGSYTRVVSRLAKLDLLAIDDWLLHPLKDADRRDLMEVIEERAERGSMLIATQLPVKQWHTAIGDPNHADALCDRVLHRARRITLKGASLRKTKTAPEMTTVDA